MLPCTCRDCAPNKPRFPFPKTIKDGRLQFLSVSSVEKFDSSTPFGCERAWGFAKIQGLKEPQSRAQEVGNEVHEQLQHYTSTGQDRLGPIPREGKHFVHGPGPGLLVEHEELGAVTVAGVPFYVRMDLQNSGDYWLDNEGERRALDCVEVVDHKTSSDIKSWGKSGRDLLETTQMVVYGAYALRDGTAPRVRLSHCYYGTRRREALKVSAVATRQEIDDQVGAIAGIVERMKVAAGAPRAVDLEPDYTKCGRCAHVSICPRPASAQFLSIYALTGGPPVNTLPTGGEQKMPSVLELLKMKKTEAPVPAPVGQVGVVVPSASAPAAPAIDQAAVNARVAELEAQLAAAKAGPAPNVTLTGPAVQALAPDAPAGSAYMTSANLAAAAGVLPPDAPKSGESAPKADPIPEAQLATMSPAIQQAHAEVFAPTITQAHEAAALGAPDADAIMAAAEAANPGAKSPEAPAPAKKTRSKKSEPEVATYANTPTAVNMTFVPASSVTSPMFVFVDAVVSGAVAAPLDSYVDEILAGICETAGTFDVRAAPSKDSILAYGAWKGIVRARVKASPPPPGVYALRVGSCEVREEVAWGLQSIPGAVVVRGVR